MNYTLVYSIYVPEIGGMHWLRVEPLKAARVIPGPFPQLASNIGQLVGTYCMGIWCNVLR